MPKYKRSLRTGKFISVQEWEKEQAESKAYMEAHTVTEQPAQEPSSPRIKEEPQNDNALRGCVTASALMLVVAAAAALTYWLIQLL